MQNQTSKQVSYLPSVLFRKITFESLVDNRSPRRGREAVSLDYAKCDGKLMKLKHLKL